jgi:hypothetical protein
MRPTFINRWFRLDRFTDRESRRRATTLVWIGLINSLVTGSILILMLVLGDDEALYSLVGFVISLVLLWIVTKGWLDLASWLFPGSMFIVTTMIVVQGLGLYDSSLLIYAAIITLAGLLLGRRGLIVYTGLAISAIVVIGLLQVTNTLDVIVTRPDGLQIVLLGIEMALIGLLNILIIASMEDNLHVLRDNETALALSNQELTQVRTSLEKRVEERTRSAATALLEAEAARQAMEEQIWLTEAVARLNVRMRGEQSVGSLANNVIEQLCEDMEAQVGALFICKGDLLTLAGSYAFLRDERIKSEFRTGEGLIGQVALNMQRMILDQIPAEAVRISSGLGEIIPNQLLIYPVVYNAQTICVIELGALDEFSETKRDLLTRSIDNIAIALITAQTRAQVNALLEETQRQAEELQAQEEELRAINEELQAQAESLRGESGLQRLQAQASGWEKQR